jgi:hypothetical protein
MTNPTIVAVRVYPHISIFTVVYRATNSVQHNPLPGVSIHNILHRDTRLDYLGIVNHAFGPN